MELRQIGPDLMVSEVGHFDASASFGCGQCFRFSPTEDGYWEGVAGRRPLRLRQQEGSLLLCDTSLEEFEELWRGYFDLDRDYNAIIERMSAYPPLADAAGYAPGIRIFRQDGWEALCSFIISQNNHIQRIAGIIERLCQTFGDPLPGGRHTFPSPAALAGLHVEDLAVLRAGFRAKYILDAAVKVVSREVDLAAIPTMDTNTAVAELCKITGVGIKVASCALLFGFGRVECLPVDVWIGRALAEFFPDGFPADLADVAGIVQQYLFQYVRLCPEALAR